VIWFRSWFEREELEKRGLIFPAVRWQHSFGIHNIYKDLPSMGSSQLSTLVRLPVEQSDDVTPAYHKPDVTAPLNVIICFYRYIRICNYDIRKNIGPADSKVLLLGGRLSDWMNSDEFLGATDIKNILLASNESTTLALLLLESSKFIYILHATRLEYDMSSTTDDIIWPLVFAATKGIKIHLFSANTHLESLARNDCQVFIFLVSSIYIFLNQQNFIFRSGSTSTKLALCSLV